jgi:hypothetical protein
MKNSQDKKFIASPDLVGKYINRYGYSDVHVVGKIVGIKSKTIVVVQRVNAEKDPTWKPEWVSGGFSAVCLNQSYQRWIFNETNETFPMRLSAGDLKRAYRIDDKPIEFYDYNF